MMRDNDRPAARILSFALGLLSMVTLGACAKPPSEPAIACDLKLVSVLAFDRSSFDGPSPGAPGEFRSWTENPAGWALHFDLSSRAGLRFGNPTYWDRWNRAQHDLEFISYAATAYDCGDPAKHYEPSRIIFPGYMPTKESHPVYGPLTPDGDSIYAVYLRPPTSDVCLRVIGTRRDGRTAASNEVRISAAAIDEAVRARKIVAPRAGPTLHIQSLQAPMGTADKRD